MVQEKGPEESQSASEEGTMKRSSKISMDLETDRELRNSEVRASPSKSKPKEDKEPKKEEAKGEKKEE